VPTGGTYSTGSPATAAADNVGPITVNVVQLDTVGTATVVGSFELAPGASVDVTSAAAQGGDSEAVRFHVIRGLAPATLGGRTQTLRRGTVTTLPIHRTQPGEGK